LVVLVASALAAQVSIDADTRALQAGDSTRLRVTVVGASPDYAPELPDVDGLRFTYIGSRPTRVTINFKTERLVTYTWQVTAEKPGDFTVGPVDISVRDQTLKTAALTFKVSERSDVDGMTSELVDEAWVGQIVVHRVGLRTTERLLDSSWSLPPYDGMLIEPSAQARNRSYTTVVDNQTVEILELDTPLRLTRAGEMSVPGTVLTVQVPVASRRNRPGFGGGLFTEVRNEVFSSPAETLLVQALPSGQEENWSGLVGRFEIESYLTDSTIAAGESTTRVVRISGDGTLAGLELPVDEDAGYRAYADAAEVETELRDGGFWSRVTFRQAIVPEAEGPLVLPELVLQVFDPVQGVYTALVVPEERLEVTPGDPSASALQTFTEGRADRRAEVDELGEDILPIHADAGGTDLPSGWFLLGGIPGLVALAARLRPQAKREDPRVALQKRLTEELTLAEAEALFRELLALRLGTPAAGLEREHLEALPETIRGDATALYKDLEAARYGGADDTDLIARVRAIGGALCS